MQFDVSREDFSARWEAFHWPLRLKLKEEEAAKLLEEDRSLLQKEMGAQQQQFERNLEELAYRVANFHQYDDISRVAKVRRATPQPPRRLPAPTPLTPPHPPHPLPSFLSPLQVTAMVADIQQALKDYEAKAQIFNTREALFGEPATEYEQLAKLVKDFEPYASLWTTAADWQKWQREWLDARCSTCSPTTSRSRSWARSAAWRS